MKKDKSLIPRGLYCYNKNKTCPYWKKIKDRDKQENGWCDYLGRGDYELNREVHEYKVTSYKDGKPSKVSEFQTGPNNPGFFSLIWDMVKECGINDEIDEEEWT